MSAEVHTPSYLMRRRLLLRLLRAERPARLLEIGCGRGELLGRLARLGWEAVGLETAPEAAVVARGAVAGRRGAAVVLEDPAAVAGTFPLVIASEVLEHLPDDAGALRRWRGWVAPGGKLILTVPAHARYWTRSDEFVGHVRRYERADLARLVAEAGFTVEAFWSFGFPVGLLTVPIRQLLYRRRLEGARGTPLDARTGASAFESASRAPGGRFAAAAAEAVGAVAHWLQLPFLSTDLGPSYLVVARRGSEELAS